MPTCTVTALTSAAKCFNCLSKTEKRALRVWFLAQGLKAGGGEDQTNVNTLSRTVACLKCEPDFVLDSFLTVIAQRYAAAKGANVNLSIQALRAAIKCYMCGDPKMLRAAEVYLRCQIQ